MQKEFLKPLRSTAIIIGAVVILIASLGISGASGGVGTIAQFILFLLGLGVGILITIAVSVGIFFAAAFMANKEHAASMWKNFKGALSCSC